MKTAVFYHAGCPVCIDAERQVAESLDSEKFNVDVVDLKQDKARIGDAEANLMFHSHTGPNASRS